VGIRKTHHFQLWQRLKIVLLISWFFNSYNRGRVGRDVGWVGTKWKPTIFNNGMVPFHSYPPYLTEMVGFRFASTHPTLASTHLTLVRNAERCVKAFPNGVWERETILPVSGGQQKDVAHPTWLTGFENLSGLRLVTLANQEIRFLEKIGFLNSFGTRRRASMKAFPNRVWEREMCRCTKKTLPTLPGLIR